MLSELLCSCDVQSSYVCQLVVEQDEGEARQQLSLVCDVEEENDEQDYCADSTEPATLGELLASTEKNRKRRKIS